MKQVPFESLFSTPLRNGLNRPTKVRGAGVKMVNMGELFAHPRIKDVPMDRVPLDGGEQERFLLAPGDLLFARQSLVREGAGKCAIFLGDSEAVTFEGHLIRVRLDPKRADSRFYFYFFQSALGRVAIESIIEQVAAAGIRGSDLARLAVPAPEIGLQRQAADALNLLDDRIAHNAALNQTLESITRALFRSWFVDFDPVRAKMEGCPTGLPDDVAALFPDRLAESPLGMVPENWQVGEVGDAVEVSGGSTPSTKDERFWGGSHSWATPKDLANLSSPVLLETERTLTDAGLAETTSGLLPVGSVLLSSRAPIGYLAITEMPVAVNQGFIAMVCDKSPSNLFMLQWARENHDAIVARANGTTFLEISKKAFRPMPLLLPPDDVMQAFTAAVEPLHRRVVANLRQSATLADLRDTLLPRLLSGEVRLPDEISGATV